MESIIKVENVSKKFGADTALNNVSIEFESGKIYGKRFCLKQLSDS